VKTFSPGEIEIVGPTNHGVRFTFRNGERWIFGRCNVTAVMNEMVKREVPTTQEVVPARWTPPL